MFTGIVQHLGRVLALESNDFGAVLRVDSVAWDHGPAPGVLQFDVIRQTLEITTLGGLEVGDPVNLEHAVTPSTMLGGHIVQGHIDGVGTVREIIKDDSQWRVRFEPPGELMDCIVEKGSIAIDGTSLTLANVGDDFFEVALIPTTLEMTTLGTLETGHRVNLETDYIAKTVVNWLNRREEKS